MRILFLGTPSFAVPVLDAVHKSHEIIAVVTQPDKPSGRGQKIVFSPVKQKALELGLPIFQPEKASEISKLIKEPFDFLITAAYGQILPEAVLQMPKKDALNVHASLLPKYRGATPLQAALLHGDSETGVSIMRMVKKMDCGPVFAKRKIPIHPDMKYPDLEQEASLEGAKLLLKVLSDYDHITPLPQDENEASYCSKISKENGKIDFGKESAEDIYNKLRAFTPWPGIYTFFDGKKLEFLDVAVSPVGPEEKLQPGVIFQKGKKCCVVCKNGALEIKKVQLEGKKPVDVLNFLNGYPQFKNTRLS